MTDLGWIAATATGVASLAGSGVVLYRQGRALRASKVALEREQDHRRSVAAALDQKIAELEQAWATNRSYQAETEHLLSERLTAALTAACRQARGAGVPEPLETSLGGSVVAGVHQRILALVTGAAEQLRADIAGAARLGLVHALGGPQTRLVRLLHQLTEAMERHGGNPDVVETLMVLDGHASAVEHGVRRLQIASGDVPMVQRPAVPIAEVIEGSRGRIENPSQVRYLHNPATADVWVSGRAAEPLMLALTELLDNGASHSTRHVDVAVEDVAAGYAITVSDRGLPMAPEDVERANRVMAGDDQLDVLTGGAGLGFLIVGRLASRYGFTARVEGQSLYSGNRAAVVVPSALLTSKPEDHGDDLVLRRLANPPSARLSPPVSADSSVQPPLPTTQSGLPVRSRRRVPRPALPAATMRVVDGAGSSADPDESAASLAALAAAFDNTDNTSGERDER